jgi:hypothetical protein
VPAPPGLPLLVREQPLRAQSPISCGKWMWASSSRPPTASGSPSRTVDAPTYVVPAGERQGTNGHELGPNQVVVGHVACLGHGEATTWKCRTCDQTVHGHPRRPQGLGAPGRRGSLRGSGAAWRGRGDQAGRHASRSPLSGEIWQVGRIQVSEVGHHLGRVIEVPSVMGPRSSHRTLRWPPSSGPTTPIVSRLKTGGERDQRPPTWLSTWMLR